VRGQERVGEGERRGERWECCYGTDHELVLRVEGTDVLPLS
jgi:hypothetical protein